MSSLVGFIRDYQQLRLPANSAAAELFERAFKALLDAEGPPAEPIAGISSEVRTAVARTPKGRPMFLCHTWETEPWTCLLLDLAPVVMGRPVFVPNPNGQGLPRVVTDYRSQKFQRRIGAACHALTLPPPPEPSQVCSLLDLNRVFLAWSPLEGNPPILKGDLDNYAKNVLDALQRARIVTNDRTVASITFARSHLPAATETLDAHLLSNLLKVKAEHPKLNRRTLAKKAGLSQRTVKRLLSAATNPKTGPAQPASAPTTPDLISTGPLTQAPALGGAGNGQESLPVIAPGSSQTNPGLPLSATALRRRQRPRRPRPGRGPVILIPTPVVGTTANLFPLAPVAPAAIGSSPIAGSNTQA